jgi:hypothetical protein
MRDRNNGSHVQQHYGIRHSAPALTLALVSARERMQRCGDADEAAHLFSRCINRVISFSSSM